jgi:hypothetical protein
MIGGGKIANRQNLIYKDGPVPGEYRGQPVVGAQTYQVKAGDWLLIPPDTPHCLPLEPDSLVKYADRVWRGIQRSWLDSTPFFRASSRSASTLDSRSFF